LVEIPNYSNWLTFFRNISYINFFNNGSIYFLINVYSNSCQTALKYLKDTKANISKILIMARDFNIRDSSWDSSFPHHSIYCDFLNNIADSMDLCMFKATNHVPTRYLDNQNNSNSVIDLMFLYQNLSKLDNHMIHPEWRLLSDYMLLTVNIAIIKEHIQTKKCTIIKNSKEERNFITELIIKIIK